MDLAQLRSDLAELLGQVGVLRVYPTVPESPTGPSAVIRPDDFEYHATYDGAVDPDLVVMLMTPATSAKAQQTQLDGWISTGNAESAVDAIEADGRFRVVAQRAYGAVLLVDGGSRYYTSELLVSVLA